MRFFSDSDVTVPVIWYRCAPWARPMPFPHAFGNTFFYTEEERYNGAIGEVPDDRQWRNGARRLGAMGQGVCGARSRWTVGLVRGENPQPVERNRWGLPVCCNRWLPPWPEGEIDLFAPVPAEGRLRLGESAPARTALGLHAHRVAAYHLAMADPRTASLGEVGLSGVTSSDAALLGLSSAAASDTALAHTSATPAGESLGLDWQPFERPASHVGLTGDSPSPSDVGFAAESHGGEVAIAGDAPGVGDVSLCDPSMATESHVGLDAAELPEGAVGLDAAELPAESVGLDAAELPAECVGLDAAELPGDGLGLDGEPPPEDGLGLHGEEP